MRQLILWGASALLLVATGDAGVSDSQVIARDLHSATVQRVQTSERGGTFQSVTNHYTRLATGLHRMEDGVLVEADPVIELAPGGAIAEKTRHKIQFSANINNWEGAIDLLAPDGKRFLSRPLGVSYYDNATGESVLIAELQDSVGTLFPPNKIVYENAFTDFNADLEYNNFRAGLQQNLIFREAPPEPAAYGLNNETTVIQLLTEFFTPPEAVKQTELVDGLEDDVVLDFGEGRIGVGKSFMVDDEKRSHPVGKQWIKMEGRDFLVEQIPFKGIEQFLGKLPPAPQARNADDSEIRHIVSTTRMLPKREVAVAPSKTDVIELASVPLPDKGFVLDYSILFGGSSVTLQGDFTYYVEDDVYCDVLTIEGGTVVKFPTNGASIFVQSNIVCLTEPYRPAVFTGRDDDSVGAVIQDSTGIPVKAGYGNFALLPLFSNASINNLRMSFLRTAVAMGGTATDLQFVSCGQAFEAFGTLNVRNTLIADTSLAFLGFSALVNAEHLTAHGLDSLALEAPDFGGSVLNLTNSLLSSVTSIGDFFTVTTQSVVTTTASGIFQQVGAGRFYLAEASPYRDLGTTNIHPTLLSNLKKKTTYPPLVLSSLPSHAVLQPRAMRDTDIPDVGYHYDPIDFALADLSADSVVVTNGAVIAFFGNEGEGLATGTFISEGTPLNPNRLVWYNTVQEQASVWNSATPGNLLIFDGQAEVRCRFTEFSLMSALPGYHLVDRTNGGMAGTFSFQDCRFSGGYFRFQSLTNYQGLAANLSWTNCLFSRVHKTVQAIDNPIYVYGFNNHFDGGALIVRTQSFGGDYGFTFHDNFSLLQSISQSAVVTNSHNAYEGARFQPTNVTDIVIPFNNPIQFTNGPLGRHYQVSTNLLNKGSRTAYLAGLYHFTTTTDQTKETNSVVDIGFHYVAVDTGTGFPFDADGDGLADHFEDANGNGTFDLGEPDWNNPDTDGDGISDGWEIFLGISPVLNESQQSAMRRNYAYHANGWLNTVFGVLQKALVLDSEGNILEVAH